MMKQRKWPQRLVQTLGGLACLLALLYAFCLRGSRSQTFSDAAERSDITYSSRPTILFPGWGGYTYSYNCFIKYAQKHHYAEHTMTVYITPHGHISTRGNLRSHHNPLVQVIYTWNYNGSYSAHIHQDAAVIEYLHQHFGMQAYNVVGHSYGGSSWVNAFFR